MQYQYYAYKIYNLNKIKLKHKADLCLDRVAAYLHHRVAAAADLETTVAQHVAPVTRPVQSGSHLLHQGVGGTDETLRVQLGSVEVTSGEGRTTHVDLWHKNRQTTHVDNMVRGHSSVPQRFFPGNLTSTHPLITLITLNSTPS